MYIHTTMSWRRFARWAQCINFRHSFLFFEQKLWHLVAHWTSTGPQIPNESLGLSAQVIWTIRRTWGLRGEWLYICTVCGWRWSYFCTISDQLSLPCFVACYINPYLLGTFGESARSLFVSVRLRSGANALKEATVQPVLQAKRVCQDSGPPKVIYHISWIHTSIMDPLELPAISSVFTPPDPICFNLRCLKKSIPSGRVKNIKDWYTHWWWGIHHLEWLETWHLKSFLIFVSNLLVGYWCSLVTLQ